MGREPGDINEGFIKPQIYAGAGSATIRNTEPVDTQKVQPLTPRLRKRGGGISRVNAKAGDHGNEEVVMKRPIIPQTYTGKGSKVEKMANGNASVKSPFAIKLTPHKRQRGGGVVEGEARRQHANRPGQR